MIWAAHRIATRREQTSGRNTRVDGVCSWSLPGVTFAVLNRGGRQPGSGRVRGALVRSASALDGGPPTGPSFGAGRFPRSSRVPRIGTRRNGLPRAVRSSSTGLRPQLTTALLASATDGGDGRHSRVGARMTMRHSPPTPTVAPRPFTYRYSLTHRHAAGRHPARRSPPPRCCCPLPRWSSPPRDPLPHWRFQGEAALDSTACGLPGVRSTVVHAARRPTSASRPGVEAAEPGVPAVRQRPDQRQGRKRQAKSRPSSSPPPSSEELAA